MLSLWLAPDDSSNVFEDLRDLISRLAGEYGGPSFLPHVTLLGLLPGDEDAVLDKVRSLASRISPYEVHLTEIKYLPEYYRSLFIEVEQTDNVMIAAADARKEFHIEDVSPYYPHLSLMYGDFPAELKEQILQELTKEKQFDNVRYTVNNIEVWRTSGPVGSWEKVAVAPLQHNVT
mmetsp:Transcript_14777/g.24405  ORF Transcript_14777/g.24405 Transcript_14777/m.24405 type:complete len:176 (-) Transcript_14777:64-591(-)|eukprot:CAMPEP_0184344932 /NCGR_PEP_ID=MMETSP1089-20130417/13398_1 /TAXON_ID=38269 ORGANISM="Gloeochaete wittrockiana, Strain SAG46.84" /NCGR_SAMPLE_ID=MMETSP1089 /ASSEMBLY_ACC=CAM_ASM_000445 /LENGTH=175 /DNA_ID=CAMNT_0026675021 /DNA_START=86 /DNA_END=613 /DNA_ORIENTATION=-